MTGYRSTLRLGYGDRPTEGVTAWVGVDPVGKIPLIMCHGFLADGTQFYDRPGQEIKVARAAAEADLVGFAPDLGGLSTWGNDDFINAVDDVIGWAGTTYGTRTDRVALYGTSMGGCCLNWAWRNLEKVVAVALTIPVVSLDGIHDRNPLGIGQFVQEAYGTAQQYEDALPTHDPSYPTNADLIATISDRVRIWYSDDDNVIAASEVLAYSAATGVVASSVGSVGHSVANDQQPVADWLIPQMWWG